MAAPRLALGHGQRSLPPRRARPLWPAAASADGRLGRAWPAAVPPDGTLGQCAQPQLLLAARLASVPSRSFSWRHARPVWPAAVCRDGTLGRSPPTAIAL